LWKDLGDAIEHFAKVAALLVAGFWTYRTFVRQRLSFPRLELAMTIEEFCLSNTHLLRIMVRAKNTGSVVAKSRQAELRLRQVVPLPEELRHHVAHGFDPIPEGRAKIEWPMLLGRQWQWGEGEFEVEPNESDTLTADFFVSPTVEVIELYFYLSNAKKGRQGLGWTLTRLHKMSRQGDS